VIHRPIIEISPVKPRVIPWVNTRSDGTPDAIDRPNIDIHPIKPRINKRNDDTPDTEEVIHSRINTATIPFFYRAFEPDSLIAGFRHVSRFASRFFISLIF